MDKKEFKQTIDDWYAGRIEVDEKIKRVAVMTFILDVEVKDFIKDLCKDNDLDFNKYWDMCKKIIDKNNSENKGIACKNDWELKEQGKNEREDFLKSWTPEKQIKALESKINELQNVIDGMKQEIKVLDNSK